MDIGARQTLVINQKHLTGPPFCVLLQDDVPVFVVLLHKEECVPVTGLQESLNPRLVSWPFSENLRACREFAVVQPS